MGRCAEYRALRDGRQLEKSYTKSALCPLAAIARFGQLHRVIGHGGALWISQGQMPV